MTLSICTKDGTASLNPMSFTDQHSSAVMERLRYQRTTGRFCDALIVVKDRKFNAHRMVLAACSPYFDSILRHNKTINERIIVNCQNPVVFEHLLNYIYTGTIVIDRSIVTELLKMSNNLLIMKLKNYCAEYLERYIDVSNCLSVKELAIKYNLQELLKKALEFFDSNVNGCLMESSDILEFSIHQLRAIIIDRKYREIIRPDVHLNLIVRWIGHNIEERKSLFEEMLQECALQQVNPQRLERMLDYNPFFAQSEPFLYIILQSMRNVGMNMDKYEVQYRTLVQKYNSNLHHQPQINELFYNENMQSAMGLTNIYDSRINSNSELQQRPRRNSFSDLHYNHNNNNNFNAEISMENRFATEMGRRNSGGEYGTALTSPTRNTECTIIDNNKQNNERHKNLPHRPSLKLKINLAGSNSESSYKKRRLFLGMKLYKKSVASAGQTLIKRRGRPPKIKAFRSSHDLGRLDEEPESCFYNFNDDIHTTIIFDEPDEWNPEMEFVGDEEDENSLQHSSNNEPNSTLNPENLLHCEHCVYKAKDRNKIKKHIAMVHSKNILYVCNLCRFECKWNRQFYDHMHQHFPQSPYQCDSCNYSAERIHVLLSHRLTHSDERPFKCSECDFRCRSKFNLIVHGRIHTGEKIYFCNECGKAFATKSAFEQHVGAHSDDRPFICDQCDFSTKYQSHLISHRRIHTGDLFRCEVEECDYSSPKKSQLAAHLRTHLAIRSHQCRICHRSFIEKSHLVRHERIHLEDKPFKCDNCDYASSRRDKLKEHILKHHDATANNKLHRRKHRRARQLAHIAAQAKLLPPDSNNFFRPISSDEYASDKQAQLQHVDQNQVQQVLPHSQISRTLSASAAADVLNATHLLAPDNLDIQSSAHLNLELLSHQQHSQQILQQPQLTNKTSSAVNNVLMSSESEQPSSFAVSSMQIPSLQNQNFAMFSQMIQHQQGILPGGNIIGGMNRPCSASLPPNNDPKALSPACYSLHDYHHAAGDLFTSSTPDTDLSTPGPPHERNPHSVSNLYNTNLSQFEAHQLANQNTSNNNEQILQSLATISAEDVQRPMSLPNYGVQQVQQFQQQHDDLSQQHHQQPQHQMTWSINNSQGFP